MNKQIEEMVEIVKPFVSGLPCGDESGACELTDCRSCKARNLVNAIMEKYYRKESVGEWIKDEKSKFKHRYHCTACDFYLIGAPTKHCPNCGARMSGGKK
jgi:rubrerythrin